MQYNVLTNLEHDKMLYVPGALIELEDAVAAPLVRDRVIEPFKERPKLVPAGSNARTQTPEEKEAARAAKEGKKTAEKPADESSDDGEPEKDLESMTAAELKEEAAKRGLSTSGTKAELVERLKTHVVDAESETDDNADDDL